MKTPSLPTMATPTTLDSHHAPIIVSSDGILGTMRLVMTLCVLLLVLLAPGNRGM